MDSLDDTARSGGLPHSEIRGSTGARPSPRLFAACHVLHRLSVPRHSPDALLTQARPRPAPSTQDQRSEDGDHRTETTLPTRLDPHLLSPCDLRPGTTAQAFAPPRLAPRRLRIPMPRSSQTERLDLLHGHNSLHDVKRQSSEVTGQIARPRREPPRLDARSAKEWTPARHSDDRFEMPDVNRRPTR